MFNYYAYEKLIKKKENDIVLKEKEEKKLDEKQSTFII